MFSAISSLKGGSLIGTSLHHSVTMGCDRCPMPVVGFLLIKLLLGNILVVKLLQLLLPSAEFFVNVTVYELKLYSWWIDMYSVTYKVFAGRKRQILYWPSFMTRPWRYGRPMVSIHKKERSSYWRKQSTSLSSRWVTAFLLCFSVSHPVSFNTLQGLVVTVINPEHTMSLIAWTFGCAKISWYQIAWL